MQVWYYLRLSSLSLATTLLQKVEHRDVWNPSQAFHHRFRAVDLAGEGGGDVYI